MEGSTGAGTDGDGEGDAVVLTAATGLVLAGRGLVALQLSCEARLPVVARPESPAE